MIKNKILIPLVFLMTIGFNLTSVFASHIVGGEMTYRCLGNGTFEIQLTVYRDCFFGNPLADFDDPAWIAVFQNGGLAPGVSNNGIITVAPPAPFDTLREILTSECFVQGDPVCVERAIHTTTVQLPYSATGYILSYQRCCRNETIRNIIEPDQTGANIWCYIPAEATQVEERECNSNPVFNQYPPIYLCTNDAIDFDHSATDADGDELRYRLCTPNTALSFDQSQVQSANQFDTPNNSTEPFDPVIFQAGYDLSNLLGGSGAAMTIDPNTGFLTGVPTEVGQYLVGVCVGEYRDGELLSETRRDFQFNVRTCEDAPLALFDDAQFNCESLEVSFNNTGTGNFFGWDFGDSSTSTEVSPTYTFSEPGKYLITLIAYVDSSCTDTYTQEIIVNNIVGNDILLDAYNVCNGTTIVANTQTSIPVTLEWSFNDSFEPAVAGPTYDLSMTDFNDGDILYVRVTDENGCVVTDETILNKTLDFDLILDEYNACSGTTVITATLPSGFLNPVIEWSFNDSFDPAVTGSTYDLSMTEFSDGDILYVRVTNESGCEITDQTILRNTLDFDIVLDEYNVCSGITEITAILPNGILNPIVEWSFNDSFDPAVTGSTYDLSMTEFSDGDILYVRVTNESGCVITDQTTLSNTLDFSLILDNYDLCSGITEITATLPDGILNPVVIWSFDPSFTPEEFRGETFIIPHDIGSNLTIYVRLLGDNGCEIDDQAMLETGIEVGDFTTNDSECGSLTVNFTYQGNSNDDISWDFGDNMTSDETNPTHIYDTSGTYIITVSAVNGACNGDSTREITVIGPDIIDVEAENISDCDGQDVTLNPGGSTDYIYVWSPSDNLDDDSSPSPIANVDSTTEFTVIVSDPNNADCFIEETVTLTVSPLTGVEFSDITSCSGEPVKLNPANDQTLSYTWSPAELFGADVNSSNPTIMVTETTIITVTVLDDNIEGCSEEFTFTVDPIDDYDVTLETSGVQCPGENFMVTTIDNDGRPLVFEWYNCDYTEVVSNDQNLEITITESTCFHLIITDDDGNCPDTLSTDAIFDEVIPVTVEVEDNMVFCPGDEVTLSITSDIPDGATISWVNPATGSGTSTTITATTTMNIDVVVTTENGCPNDGTALVEVSNFQVGARAEPGCVMGPDEIVQLGANDGAQTYIWNSNPPVDISNPNIFNPTVTGLTQNTTFTVSGLDDNGCPYEGMTSVTVQEDCNPPCLTNEDLPNLFTPNDDGVNDLYEMAYTPATLVEMFIYDRWGNEVFNTISDTEFWDGLHDGNEKPQDVYGYLIIATCPDGSEIEVTGNVTLFR